MNPINNEATYAEPEVVRQVREELATALRNHSAEIWTAAASAAQVRAEEIRVEVRAEIEQEIARELEAARTVEERVRRMREQIEERADTRVELALEAACHATEKQSAPFLRQADQIETPRFHSEEFRVWTDDPLLRIFIPDEVDSRTTIEEWDEPFEWKVEWSAMDCCEYSNRHRRSDAPFDAEDVREIDLMVLTVEYLGKKTLQIPDLEPVEVHYYRTRENFYFSYQQESGRDPRWYQPAYRFERISANEAAQLLRIAVAN